MPLPIVLRRSAHASRVKRCADLHPVFAIGRYCPILRVRGCGARWTCIPGALLISRELSLLSFLDLSTTAPTYFVGTRDQSSDGFRGSALSGWSLVRGLFVGFSPLPLLPPFFCESLTRLFRVVSPSLSSLKARKDAMRLWARSVRKAIPSFERTLAAEQSAAHASAYLKHHPGVVALYYPHGCELSTLELAQRLVLEGRQIALPVVVGEGMPLQFRLWNLNEALEVGAYGLKVPSKAAEVVRPDVLVMPLLAFDKMGGRLGQGGGFYDRTLAALRVRGQVHAIGYAHSAQEVKACPREVFDETLDAVITQTGVVFSKG
jgi:5-formyltetrahydrofolate cyclo-ligase